MEGGVNVIIIVVVIFVTFFILLGLRFFDATLRWLHVTSTRGKWSEEQDELTQR